MSLPLASILVVGTPVELRGPAAVDCSCLRVELRAGEHVRGVVVTPLVASTSIADPDSIGVDFDGHGRCDLDPLRLIFKAPADATDSVASEATDPVADV